MNAAQSAMLIGACLGIAGIIIICLGLVEIYGFRNKERGIFPEDKKC